MDTLRDGQRLNIGEKITSTDGNYFLLMQGDGNLVLFDNNNRDYWATNVIGHFATMQADGNFVVYDNNNLPVWASGTNGHPNSHLIIQNDRNLVAYQNGNVPIWASNTPKDILRNGQRLNIGEKITSSNGKYYLLMQGDGNLVLFDNNNRDYWATNVIGHFAEMQADGNFVVYDQNNHPVWASNTEGHPNAHLIIQNDRNLVIYQNGNIPIWATNTVLQKTAYIELRTGFSDASHFDPNPKFLDIKGENFYINSSIKVDCNINFGVGQNNFYSVTGNSNQLGEILINIPATLDDLRTYSRISVRITDLSDNTFIDTQKSRI
jgi:hypothetical protein